ncbi:MAG: hypothetical protein A3J76_01300 [Candidatus Moranbacteria bacterium RBG_13_45_13]|nr:MAG: hypothetical protein A3J76_01300 [Candidatus Moranbacteria bacterium RBG_13_45_13]
MKSARRIISVSNIKIAPPKILLSGLYSHPRRYSRLRMIKKTKTMTTVVTILFFYLLLACQPVCALLRLEKIRNPVFFTLPNLARKGN